MRDLAARGWPHGAPDCGLFDLDRMTACGTPVYTACRSGKPGGEEAMADDTRHDHLATLREMRERAVLGGGQEADRAAARARQADRARAPGAAARRGLVPGVRRAGHPRHHRLRPGRAALPRRRRRHRLRQDQRPPRRRLRPGLHRARRLVLRGAVATRSAASRTWRWRAASRSSASTTPAARASRRACAASPPTARSSCATSWPRASSRRSR